jgi:hypothetical protein
LTAITFIKSTKFRVDQAAAWCYKLICIWMQKYIGKDHYAEHSLLQNYWFCL